MGRKDQADQHFNHYSQHQESGAQARTDLGSESGSDQQEQRQNKIDGSV